MTALTDPLAEMEALVRSVFTTRRRTADRRRALALTALDLGITARRVRAYLAGDVGRVLAVEYLDMRRRYRAFLARDAARLEAVAETQRLRCAQLDAEDDRDGLR